MHASQCKWALSSLDFMAAWVTRQNYINEKQYFWSSFITWNKPWDVFADDWFSEHSA
jgi:hypothetical protein